MEQIEKIQGTEKEFLDTFKELCDGNFRWEGDTWQSLKI